LPVPLVRNTDAQAIVDLPAAERNELVIPPKVVRLWRNLVDKGLL
jgi:hypothetical protein